MILRVLGRGLHRAWRQRRLLLPLYGLSLVSGLLVAFPAWRIVQGFAGRSLAGEALRSGFESGFVLELLSRRSDALATLQPLLLLAFVLHLGGGLFLSGGAFACLSSEARPTPRQFWGGAAAHFGRYLRLLAWSVLPLLGLAVVTALPRLVQRVVWGEDPYQSVTSWVGRITLFVALLCLLVQVTLLDYARLDVVERGERATRKALWRSCKRLLRRFPLLFGAALTISVAGLLLLGGHRMVAGGLMGPGVGTIVALVVLQQLVVGARLAVRLWRWATVVEVRQALASFPREEMPPTQVLLTPRSGEPEPHSLPAAAEAAAASPGLSDAPDSPATVAGPGEAPVETGADPEQRPADPAPWSPEDEPPPS